jgi:hypothetical protein
LILLLAKLLSRSRSYFFIQKQRNCNADLMRLSLGEF